MEYVLAAAALAKHGLYVCIKRGLFGIPTQWRTVHTSSHRCGRTCGTSHGGVAAEALECAHSFLRLLSLGQSIQKIYTYYRVTQNKHWLFEIF